ncbi:hypothetical protein HDG37_004804 [Paraburkholderia sp. MM5384-R2]|nr:hypothetical protein [Paraburkholderia sp. MM5384-R2]
MKVVLPSFDPACMVPFHAYIPCTVLDCVHKQVNQQLADAGAVPLAGSLARNAHVNPCIRYEARTSSAASLQICPMSRDVKSTGSASPRRVRVKTRRSSIIRFMRTAPRCAIATDVDGFAVARQPNATLGPTTETGRTRLF